jgi:hypothetical protein
MVIQLVEDKMLTVLFKNTYLMNLKNNQDLMFQKIKLQSKDLDKLHKKLKYNYLNQHKQKSIFHF